MNSINEHTKPIGNAVSRRHSSIGRGPFFSGETQQHTPTNSPPPPKKKNKRKSKEEEAAAQVGRANRICFARRLIETMAVKR